MTEHAIGLTLAGMNLWIFLLLLAIGILWVLIHAFKPSREKLVNMFKMGLFLAVFDLVFETTGLMLGYWQATNSLLLLGPAVPIEVFLVALTAGAALNLLFPRFSLGAAIPTSFLIASIGTFIEAMLISSGNLVYLNSWTSAHAFVAYFLVFVFLQLVNSGLFHENEVRLRRYA
ncbi:hypothetical protein HY571_02975 [Candidatus Micrarchaeota archaeon]|nr:hypothetical protein [Candidatus Micrarchaeota archaeon]